MNAPTTPLAPIEPDCGETVTQALSGMRRRLARTDSRSPLLNVPDGGRRGSIMTLLPGPADTLVSRLLGTPDGLELRPVGRDRSGNATLLAIDTDANAALPRLFVATGRRAADKAFGGLARAACEAEEETGANFLALALGSLAWKAGNGEDETRVAPVLLLPARLVHSPRDGSWSLAAAEGDVMLNAALAELLHDSFGTDPKTASADGASALSPEAVFDEIEVLAGQRAGWALDRESRTLGLFSHVNDLLRRDLGDPILAAEASRAGSTLHQMLSGAEMKSDDDAEPKRRSPDTPFDLDASQAGVVDAVHCGRNVVVSGPPGTGKSQTIAAIIAAAAAAGKSVLFMAQKQVALDVVRDKLEAKGHGHLMLSIYGEAATASAVRARIDKGWSRASSKVPQQEDCAAGSRRDDDHAAILCAIADALHGPGPDGSDVSAWQALGQLVAAASVGEPPPRVDLSHLAGISGAEAAALEEALYHFADRAAASGPRAEHPWAGTARRDLLPTDIERLREHLAGIGPALAEIDEAGNSAKELTDRIGADIEMLPQVMSIVNEAPSVPPGLAGALWPQKDDAAFVAALDSIAAWQHEAAKRAARFAPGVERWDSSALRAPLSAGTRALFPGLLRPYRQATDALAELLAQPMPKRADARYALLLDLLGFQAAYRAVAQCESFLAEALGHQWPGRSAFDASGCREALVWMRRLAAEASGLGEAAIVAMLQTTPEQRERFSRLDHLTQALGHAMAPVLGLLGWPVPDTSADTLAVARRLERLSEHLAGYEDWVGLTAQDARIATAGLGGLAELIETAAMSREAAVSEFRFALAEARWRAAVTDRPPLAQLRDIDRNGLVARWHASEAARHARASAGLREAQAARMPQIADPNHGVSLLRRELGRKSKHMKLRQLLWGAGHEIQRMYPVFLATPYTVARFLAPEAMRFDLLVIDEASQMRPEFALGGIARAGQTVVCGDDKQLPPTDFFERAIAAEAPGQMQRIGPPAPAEPVEMESILTLARASGFHTCMLETHYRSCAASLIATSNRLFYGERLIVPPSPRDGQPGYGLTFERVDGVYQRGDQGPGRAGTNPAEAEAIAAAIARHARQNPDSSLGVATFSVAQRDAVRQSLEHLRRSDPVLDGWIASRESGPQTSVFVKNLEDVQGDERDVVMIGIGYGPGHPGGRLASQNFGPINRAGGERRLNTLFTRARELCRVFCSFDPGDIDPDGALHAGPMVLRRFLEAAASGCGIAHAPSPAGRDLIREDVANAIAGFGLPCTVGLGTAPFRIDIAIAAQQLPCGEAVAILLDTADGREAFAERERVLKRERVLEARGWRIHRIWGSDWYYRRQHEVRRMQRVLFGDPAEAR